ncbi:MAG: hypothetical protein LC624_04035 [Halobacteriales archaeon]|nr:hypothetical protein [Halobacteriales archaeon]
MRGVLENTGVPVGGWDKKSWAGNIAILFFTFLAAWILFQNPPFWT